MPVKIQNDKVVAIDYSLKVEGEIIDASNGEPLVYLHGHGNIIPGLESALLGLEPGQAKHVSVTPGDGYGEYDPEAEQVLPRDAFDDGLEIGASYTGETQEGQPIQFTVLELKPDGVLVDFNHPLAGETLEFDVTVREVRDATPEELDHGHAHHGDHAH
jgi:FKBP-type peptidyl-prolyl cis-trans isomerase SlyD